MSKCKHLVTSVSTSAEAATDWLTNIKFIQMQSVIASSPSCLPSGTDARLRSHSSMSCSIWGSRCSRRNAGQTCRRQSNNKLTPWAPRPSTMSSTKTTVLEGSRRTRRESSFIRRAGMSAAPASERETLAGRYTHMRTHTRAHTHAHTRTRMHTRTHTHADTQTHTHTHIHTHVHTGARQGRPHHR